MTHNAFWRRSEGLQTIRTECSKDFILPDSYPDIRKILYTEGTLSPDRSCIDNGRFNQTGSLVCKVLFSDENDELHTVSFTLEYAVSSPIAAEEGDAEVFADEALQAVSARALNPRKLSIKGKIELIPHIFYAGDAGPSISEDIPDASVEKQTRVFVCHKLCRLSEHSLEASEDLALPGDTALQEIVYSHLNMGTPSSEAAGGAIRFTGEATLEMLCRMADGTLRFFELPIPFHSSIDADVTPESLCMVKLIPEAHTCLPAEDATGEAHGVELDFSYSVNAWIAMPVEFSSVSDCYSVACPTETEEGSASLIGTLRKTAKQMRRMLSAQSEGMKKCIKAFPKVSVDSREQSEGKLILHCVAEVTLLGSDEKGAPMTLVLTEAFPWELEEADEASLLFHLNADTVTEAEEVKVTLTVNADLLVWQNGEVRFVSALTPSAEQTERKRSGLTLCYPHEGEDIWAVAKRYRLPQSVLLASNSIGEGALPKVLIIPSERKAVFSKMI